MNNDVSSHPLRVRELKPRFTTGLPQGLPSHPLRVRELKHQSIRPGFQPGGSHPLRVRELKLRLLDNNRHNLRQSHPLRVRELKRLACFFAIPSGRRTLYGCVN